MFIIHAPEHLHRRSTRTRRSGKRAQAAPFAQTPVPLATTERWGTAWCWPDAKREGVLPIDDSDMGCDCKVEVRDPRRRGRGRSRAIEIADGDAITDNGQETWNLLAERGIDNVILCGVHLNMCVLGRPFAIRQMVKLGKNVVLMRDMTDTMYNPERPPGVSHFAGTDLRGRARREDTGARRSPARDITGKPAFRFKGAAK